MQQSKQLSVRSAVSAAALLLLSLVAVLAALRSAPEATTAAAPQAPQRAGMLVAIDPETGALVPPTPEQSRELTAAAGVTVAPAPVRTFVLPDGTVGALLDESLHHYSIVHLDADGSLHPACLQGDATASPLPQPSTRKAAAAPEE